MLIMHFINKLKSWRPFLVARANPYSYRDPKNK